MSTKRGRSKLEEYFETGDRPTEQQFSELIHSELNQKDDDIHAYDNKIGIGTENPTAKLHVQGNNLDPNSDGVLRIDTTNSNPNSDANLRLGVFNGGTKFSWIQSHGSSPLKINSIGNNTLLNDTYGNVGIGTENPAEKLHLKGNIYVENGKMLWDKKGDRFTIKPVNDIQGGRIELFDTNSTDPNSGGITFVAEGNSIKNGYRFLHFNPSTNKWTNSLRIDGEGNQTLFDKTIYFRANGNLADENHGIGWFGDGYGSNPNKRFAGEDIDGPVLFGNNGGALGSHSGRDNIAMRWKANGNVGIGVNNPSHKLDVNGTVSIHNGGILGNESLNIFSIFSNKSVFDGPTILFNGKDKQNLDDRGSISFVANNSHQPKDQEAPANEIAFDFVSNGETYNWNSLIRVFKNGNIGMGLYNPTERLHIEGNLRMSDHNIYLRNNQDIYHGLGYFDKVHNVINPQGRKVGNNQLHSVAVDGPFLFGYNGGAIGSVNSHQDHSFDDAHKEIAMQWYKGRYVDFKGNVSIHGTKSKFPLDVNGFNYDNKERFAFYANNGNKHSGYHSSYTDTIPISIHATNRVWASEFNASSDARIKQIQHISDGKNDLNVLSQIEITDYVMKDTVANGNGKFKKVIGQQLKEVFPQAVSLSTEIIPNIYELAEVNDGWIQLNADLKVGDKVKLINEDNEEIVEVIEVNENGFKPNQEITTNNVFVYGKEVDDFHIVDYDAIAMLNVSATQELAKKIEQQEKEIQSLKEKLSKSKTI